MKDLKLEEIRIFDEDIISVKRKKDNPFQVEKEWLATDLIKEDREGTQVWIGKVIGKNQQYIHFRDNTKRSWIDVSGYEEQLEINDYLALHILVIKLENGERRVKALKVLKLNPVE